MNSTKTQKFFPVTLFDLAKKKKKKNHAKAYSGIKSTGKISDPNSMLFPRYGLP